MKFLNWPFSWLLSRVFGIKSLILYGLAISANLAESLCMALEMLLIASSLPLIAHFFTDSLQAVCNLLSDLLLWWPYLIGAKLCDCCYCHGSRDHSTDTTFRWRSSPLRYYVKWKSVLRRNLRQREFVGRVIKCSVDR